MTQVGCQGSEFEKQYNRIIMLEPMNQVTRAEMDYQRFLRGLQNFEKDDSDNGAGSWATCEGYSKTDRTRIKYCDFIEETEAAPTLYASSMTCGWPEQRVTYQGCS